MTSEQKFLRSRMGAMTPAEFHAAARDAELAEWRAVNQFCGKCGASMEPHPNPSERAMRCPKCGYTAYPKISPAVIVLVEKDGKILLQQNNHYGISNWTLVAGFVDAGETFEECVVREVQEEASIEIKNLRYFASQAWPFPSNIMVAFRAEWAAGELHADGEEVSTSDWFPVDKLPELPIPGSIARAMIDAWIHEKNSSSDLKQPSTSRA